MVLALLTGTVTAVGCARTPPPEERVETRSGDFVPACNGNASVDVNNSGGIPVDVYAEYGEGDEVLLGPVQPGRAKFGVTRTPVAAFVTRRVNNRVIMETTRHPNARWDFVTFTPVCSA